LGIILPSWTRFHDATHTNTLFQETNVTYTLYIYPLLSCVPRLRETHKCPPVHQQCGALSLNVQRARFYVIQYTNFSINELTRILLIFIRTIIIHHTTRYKHFLVAGLARAVRLNPFHVQLRCRAACIVCACDNDKTVIYNESLKFILNKRIENHRRFLSLKLSFAPGNTLSLVCHRWF
jgi:hypothetical protein